MSETTMNINEFYRKLKRHLANDYLTLSERKNNLEDNLVQLKVDKDRSDKKLFETYGQNNVKQYFSPLNIENTPGKNNDERLEQLKADISRVESEIQRITEKLEEVQQYLTELDWLSQNTEIVKIGENAKK